MNLGDVCKINPRRPAKLAIEPDAKTTFVPMAGVDGESGTIAQPQVKNFSEVSRGYTYFEEGDVLFAKITPCMQNGKHAVASGLLNGFGFGSTEFHVVRTSDAIMAEWIHSFLRQPRVLTEAQRHFRGAVGQQRVPKEFLIDLSIPLPPLAEQKRIVARLNAQMAVVDRAKAAAREILDAAEALNSAIIRELMPYLGHQLADNWKWAKLGNLCVKIKTVDPRRDPDGAFTYVDISSIDRDDKRIANPSALTGKDAPSRARRVIHKGDVLVATTRPNLNAVALVGDALDGQICSTGLCVLRPNRHLLDSKYLYYWTRHDGFVNALSALVNGAMYPAVTDRQVLEQQIPIPSISQQRRIAALIDKQLAESAKIAAAARGGLDAVEAMPSALLRRALGDGG